MQYTIYLRTNLVNNKQYVGQTSDFKRREWEWNYLKHRYANDYLSDDRAKYGLGNWTVEVLAETDNREEAWNLEQRFIKDYSTIYPFGYNLAKGGAGSKGYKLSEEEKQKLSEAKKGTHHTDEAKQKMSEARKGIIPKCVTPKQVYQYTLDGKLVAIWPSSMECGRNGYNQGSVVSCCNGKRKTHKGFKWSYILL